MKHESDYYQLYGFKVGACKECKREYSRNYRKTVINAKKEKTNDKNMQKVGEMEMTESKQDSWKSVNCGTPESGVEVQVKTECGCIFVGTYNDGTWTFSEGQLLCGQGELRGYISNNFKITHWR